MKLRSISLAVLLGIGSISSPLLLSQTVQAAEFNTQETAEQVQQRLQEINRATQTAYQRAFNQIPGIKSIDIQEKNFQQTDTGATDENIITIKFNPAYLEENDPKSAVITLKNDITFNQELADQDILAHIEGHIVVNDELKQLLELSESKAKRLSNALQYLNIETDLLKDDKIKQTISIKPFEYEEKGGSISYEGLTFNSQFDQEDIPDFAGKSHLESGKLTIVTKEHNTNNAATDKSDGEQSAQQPDKAVTSTLVLDPFTADYTFSKDGDLDFKSSPLRLHETQDNINMSLDRISGTGSNLKFDDNIASYLGEISYTLDKLQFKDNELQSPLSIDSIKYTVNNEKEDGLYNLNNSIKVDVDGESFTKAFGQIGLEVEDIGINYKFTRLSQQAMKTFMGIMRDLQQTNPQPPIAQVEQLIGDMAKNESGIKLDFALNTDQGDATFVGDIHVKKGATSDVNTWQAATNAPSPAKMLNLIQNSFAFDIKLNIPGSLVKATKMEPLMAMGAAYIIKDGSDYSMHLENDDDGIKLNGNKLPIPEDTSAAK